MTPFSDAFVPQLIATVAGAAIGIAGVLWGFHLQRRGGAADGVDRAIEHLMLRLAEWTQIAQESRRASNLNKINMLNRAPVFSPPGPHDGSVSIAIELLRVKLHDRGLYVGRARDSKVVKALSTAWDQVVSGTLDGKVKACGVIAGALMTWRTGGPIEEVERSLEHAVKLAREEKSDPAE